MGYHRRLQNFILPDLTGKVIVRMVLVALAAYIVFGYLLIPIRIQGASMEPTFRDGSFNFCWRLQYLFSDPKHYDIVTIRFAGRKVMLLKRVVSLAGETVEFRRGALLVNGKMIEEPYVQYPSDWNLEPREVKSGNVYVVGDNRSVPIHQHHFGQVSVKRIVGGVVL